MQNCTKGLAGECMQFIRFEVYNGHTVGQTQTKAVGVVFWVQALHI